MFNSENTGGVIAAGDKTTALAGINILKAGGNAFDAAVAATFVSFVSESTLTSLGGGGFCLSRTPSGKTRIFDFFTQTPLTKNKSGKLDFYSSYINFQDSIQEFKIGLSTAAVPGNIAGLFHIHKKLGRMPVKDILQPAIDAARNGVAVTPFIRHNFHVITEVLLAEKASRDIYKPGGKLLKEGERYHLRNFADMMETLGHEGPREFYEGHYAKCISMDSKERGGHLTMLDFNSYKVIERKPLHFSYRGNEIYTNSPPSSGGVLIAFMLKLLEKVEFDPSDFGNAYHLNCLVDTMRLTARARNEKLDHKHHNANVALDFLKDVHFDELAHILQNHTSRFRNTTHLSVADKEGNVAAISTSFGTGCGYIIPGTDSMLNNMLGEEDLNRAGFHNWKPNERITSMMAPTLISKNGYPLMALGTGGANRIRTAILQVISNTIDFNMEPNEAVNSQRVHWEDNTLSLEPGFRIENYQQIEDFGSFEIVPYQKNNMFFGGVHAVAMDKDWRLRGAGDKRREGTVMEC